jgi:hypothetical protein
MAHAARSVPRRFAGLLIDALLFSFDQMHDGSRLVIGPRPRAPRPVPQAHHARVAGLHASFRKVADTDLIRVFRALEEAGARYLVVGGVAVVLHGYPRFTADLDLVLALEPENARRTLAALDGLGFRPRAPVPLATFADAAERETWIIEKGLLVFSLWNPAMPLTEIDLFVREPFPFDEAFARCSRVDLGGLVVSVASIDDLVALKRTAGRPKDLEDIQALLALKDES